MFRIQASGDSLTVRAPAKINVGLRVRGRRDDGYHEIESVFLAVDLADTLSARLREDGQLSLEVSPEGADAPADESNLVLKAARLLQQETAGTRGAVIGLTKRIPAGRGLGGGSSDAAAALVLLSALWGLELSPSRLRDLAARLGSDVPFFLNGPVAIVRGRGEKIHSIESRGALGRLWIVLVVPPVEISTREVYARAKPSLTRAIGAGSFWCTLLLEGHVRELGKCLSNDLELPAQAVWGELRTLRHILEDAGACCVSMSGSGSAMFALTREEGDARQLAERLRPVARGDVHVLRPWNAGDSS